MQPPVDHVLVRTTKPKAAAAVRIGAGLGQQKRVELAGLLQVCFARVEPWLQARKYVSAVASGLARRHGRSIAEQAGERSPDKTPPLRHRAGWGTWGAMGVGGWEWGGGAGLGGASAGGGGWGEDGGGGLVRGVRPPLPLGVAGGGGGGPGAGAAGAGGKNRRRWEVRSAGAGSKGQRWY